MYSGQVPFRSRLRRRSDAGSRPQDTLGGHVRLSRSAGQWPVQGPLHRARRSAAPGPGDVPDPRRGQGLAVTAAERDHSADLGAPEATPRTTVTFEAYAEGWLARRELKARTHEHYRWLLDEHLYPAFGSDPLTALTADDVRAWHATTLTDRPTLRSHAYGLLRTILATAAPTGRSAPTRA